ncbi:MAG: hypothetical protein HOO99_06400 [Hyphomicrobiaceae bacterium]|nr:hypothetical protein [Hyphomicrobiaceae bacterium]
MAKRPTKYEKPLKIDMDFNEALGRFAQVKPKEISEIPKHDLVPLTEDDTGHRFLIYQTKDGPRTDLRFEGSRFWASQGQMASMFDVTPQNISMHLKNIFAEGELPEQAVCKESLHTGRDGKQYPTRFYDLNALISVGFRVGSVQGTMFRVWATDKLFQIATKGFYIDKERLMNQGEPDALDEFKEIAAEIRGSIRNSYREVLKLCTLCSDYDGSSQSARSFFMDMENKLLFASTEQKTGPQLILERCDAEKDDVGLTYYAGKRGPTKRDVVVANNYLAQGESRTKNRITVMWLTYVEEQLAQGRLPTMAAVKEKLIGFIKFNQ